jgi:hypothetical protein
MPKASRAGQVLLEDVCGQYRVDRSAGSKGIISEQQLATGGSLFRIPGRFSVCNTRNGNNRRYTRSVWENNLKPEAPLQQLISKNAAFGLLEHPEDGVVNLRDPNISHIVVKAELLPEDQGSEVVGEILILDCGDNSPGRRLKTFIEAGYNPYVSSRGFGSLKQAADGVDEVQEDFVCEGWDVVHKPSFDNAELWPHRGDIVVAGESKVVAKAEKPVMTVVESSPDASSSPSTPPMAPEGATAPGALSPLVNQKKTNTMEHKEIRAQLDALKATIGGGKLEATQLSETTGRLDQLHREVEGWLHEDEKTRSWDAKKLHGEITGLEGKVMEMAQAPATKAVELQEQNTKLLKVTRLVAEKAVHFRKKLGESYQRNNKIRTLSGKLLERGRQWQEKATKLQEGSTDLDFQLDVVSTTLDMLVEQYNTDISKLAKKLIIVKFGETLKGQPEIQKKLDEAKTPKAVYAIYEELSPKKALTKPTEGETAGDAIKGDEKKKAENVVAPEAKAELASTKESIDLTRPNKPADQVTIVSEVKDPRQLSESVDIAKRLSAALTAPAV